MGHIVNPNIYRLGTLVPWISSGFKRKKNERSKVANEDFLIYNFTRNFFYKRVYKKVIGKIIKKKLKVKGYRRVRKSKRKRKFGKTSILNHWIIKYSHLTITRFNKTFQLNLFFFDRELQRKYKLRHKRNKQQLLNKKQKKKLKSGAKVSQGLETKLNMQLGRKNIDLTTAIKIGSTYNSQETAPKLETLSKEMSLAVSKIIKKPRAEKINYSIARDLRVKGQKAERIYIYKDNTFETTKVGDRLPLTKIEIENTNYKNIYYKKLVKKIYRLKRYKFTKLVPNYKFPKAYNYIDSFYFKTQARFANNYLFAKGAINDEKYNKKKRYIEVIRKNKTLGRSIREKQAKNVGYKVVDTIIDRYESSSEYNKYNKGVKKIKRKEIIKALKQNELWKKHYLRLKIARKVKRRIRRIKKGAKRSPHKYARSSKIKERN